jgi:hypothetical protein
VDTGSHGGNYTLNLNMIASVEMIYDYIYLIGGGGNAADPIGNDVNLIEEIIASGSSGNARLLVTWTGSIHATTLGADFIDTTPGTPVTITGTNGGQPDSLTADIIIGSGHRALYFVFRTDCLYSPQDGLWPFGNGALFDDLSTSDNGVIYSDAAAAGGTDSFGGAVLVGTGASPVVSSRTIPRLNQKPTLTPPSNQIGTEGASILLTATATDPDAGDLIQMSAAGYPPGPTLTASTGNPASATLSGPLSCATAPGSPYTIVWCATSLFYNLTATSQLSVVPDPHAPVVAAPASLTRAVGSVVFFEVSVSDPDGDAIGSLTADLTGLPPGNDATLGVNPGNRAGAFTWTLLSGNEGDYNVRFSASNTLQGCTVTHIHVVPGGVTDVTLDPAPAPVLLGQNRPNPFNPETSIRIHLPQGARVVLDIFDVRGRRVVRLLDEDFPAGYRDVFWDGRDARGNQLPTGIYLYRMEAAGASLSRRMVLLR